MLSSNMDLGLSGRRGMRMRFVVFFGSAGFIQFAGIFGPLVPRQRGNHDDDVAAIEFGFEILVPVRFDLAKEFSDDIEANFCVGHFPAAKFEGDFDLHVFAKKIYSVCKFDAQVMGINTRAELDFLDGGSVLVFARFFFLFGLFVPELEIGRAHV